MASVALFFRVVYTSAYTFLCFILVLLLLVTPGDVIRQALGHGQTIHVLIIAGGYIITIGIVAFIYAARLYVNRSVLASIPKSWIPIDKGDVTKEVRRMIVSSLSRSAAIAFDARPHPARPAPSPPEGSQEGEPEEDGRAAGKHGGLDKKAWQVLRLKKTATVEDELGITLPPHRPVWGDIEHYGWASPDSLDLPNLQYSAVIAELPNLVEAKALTLAPPDPQSRTDPPTLDPEAVALLQRVESMSLRDYLAHLHGLGVLPAAPTTADFVSIYEYARYSTRPLSNASFRELMRLFAEVLRSLESLDPAVLATPDDDGDDDDKDLEEAPSMWYESDIDNDAPLRTNPTTPRTQRSQASLRSAHSSAAFSTASTSSGASQVYHRHHHHHHHHHHHQQQRPPDRSLLQARNSSQNTWQFLTAPNTPRGSARRTPATLSRSSTSSSRGFAPARKAYAASQLSSSSSGHRAPSLRAGSVASSASGGSVIRLAERGDRTDLPYVLTLAESP